jgi:hypothetical protein
MLSSVRWALTPKPVAVFLALALSSIASGSLIFNNSFETPVQSTDGFTYDPGGSGWTFDGNSGIAAEGSPWFSGSPPDGTQAAILQAYEPDGPASTDSISQTLTGLNVGDVAPRVPGRRFRRASGWNCDCRCGCHLDLIRSVHHIGNCRHQRIHATDLPGVKFR